MSEQDMDRVGDTALDFYRDKHPRCGATFCDFPRRITRGWSVKVWSEQRPEPMMINVMDDGAVFIGVSPEQHQRIEAAFIDKIREEYGDDHPFVKQYNQRSGAS